MMATVLQRSDSGPVCAATAQVRAWSDAPCPAPRRHGPPVRLPGGVTVRVVLVSALSERQVRACLALTLERGAMGPALMHIRKNMRPEVRNGWMRRTLQTERVVLVRRDRALVAWALVQCANPRVAPRAYLYVRPDCRRQGLGTLLLGEVLARWQDAHVFPWDPGSYEFFAAQARPLQLSPGARAYCETHAAQPAGA